MRARPPWEFDLDSAQRILNQQLGTQDLSGFGCGHLPIAIVRQAVYCNMPRIPSEESTAYPSISVENREDGVALDAASRRNLELDTNLNGGHENTLFDVLNNTATSMASRFAPLA